MGGVGGSLFVYFLFWSEELRLIFIYCLFVKDLDNEWREFFRKEKCDEYG